MSDYDSSFARAQKAYDNQPPPELSKRQEEAADEAEEAAVEAINTFQEGLFGKTDVDPTTSSEWEKWVTRFVDQCRDKAIDAVGDPGPDPE